MNVVIDEAMNAWVIDFCGMNNVEFVDDEKRETVEGDKQGIIRLFQEWLPSRFQLHGEDQYARERLQSSMDSFVLLKGSSSCYQAVLALLLGLANQ